MKIAVNPEDVVNRLASLRLPRDVLRAVVSVRDGVKVQLPPASRLTPANLCHDEAGAAKGEGSGAHELAHGLGVVEATRRV